MTFVTWLTDFLVKFKDIIVSFFAYLLGKKQGRIEVENEILKAKLERKKKMAARMRLIHERWEKIVGDYNRTPDTDPMRGDEDKSKQ